jgi:hypothetical protein
MMKFSGKTKNVKMTENKNKLKKWNKDRSLEKFNQLFESKSSKFNFNDERFRGFLEDKISFCIRSNMIFPEMKNKNQISLSFILAKIKENISKIYDVPSSPKPVLVFILQIFQQLSIKGKVQFKYLTLKGIMKN